MLVAGLLSVQFGLLDAGAAGKPASPRVDQQLQAARVEMAQTSAGLGRSQARVVSDDRELASVRADAERLRQHIAALARSIYVGDSRPTILVIFAAPDLAQGIHAAMDVQAVSSDSRRDTGALDRMRVRVADLERDKVAAMADVSDLTQKLQVQLAQTQGLDVWSKVRLWDEANHGMSGVAKDQLGSSISFTWPLSGGRLSQGYGPTRLGFEPPFAGFPHFHTGYDIAGSYGSPVAAAFDGVVIGSQSDVYGYGKYVVIGHPDGTATLYAHLSAISVLPGQSVLRGQVLGAEGSTGNSTGPHLHFEILVDGQPVDPAAFVSTP